MMGGMRSILRQACVNTLASLRILLPSWAWIALGAATAFLLIHESPLTDALFLLVSKSDEVTTT